MFFSCFIIDCVENGLDWYDQSEKRTAMMFCFTNSTRTDTKAKLFEIRLDLDTILT